jgi:hypothetical protein
MLLWQAPVFAALGGDAHSLDADRTVMSGQLRSTSMQQYDLHEITTSGGTVIHEYMTRQGTVFAVTWRGPFAPNLQQLFGSYYQQFQKGVAGSAPGMHRVMTIAQPDFVMHAVGLMRSYHGSAYVPSLVPTGVSVGTLQ